VNDMVHGMVGRAAEEMVQCTAYIMTHRGWLSSLSTR